MRTVKELSAEANNYVFSPNISFRKWTHVLKTIQMQAQGFLSQGDHEDAYILYLRWADLVLNKLPNHPEVKQSRHRYEQLIGQLNRIMRDAESVKQFLVVREKQAAQQATQPRTGAYPDKKAHRSSKMLDKPLPAPPDLSSVDVGVLRSLRPSVPSHRISTASIPAAKTVRFSYPVVEDRTKRDSGPLTTIGPQPGSSPSTPLSAPSASSHHKTVSRTEGGGELRTLFVPNSLQQQFLKVAHENTQANLETCGILCGRLNRNAYFVTDLVIPHQESTPNSCSTTNEEELFDYVESKDVFILGWIHTHPTQSCFMSSVDLHSQNSYQIMLPEAIAIVCSPRHNPSWGAFRLTSPPGMDIIKKCRETGFHPHHEKNIYTSVMPGHMRLYDYEFTTTDLRG